MTNLKPRTRAPSGRASLSCSRRAVESIESSALQTAERQLTVTTPSRSAVGAACSATRGPTATPQQSWTFARSVGGNERRRSSSTAPPRARGLLRNAPIFRSSATERARVDPNLCNQARGTAGDVRLRSRNQGLTAGLERIQKPCAANRVELAQNIIK